MCLTSMYMAGIKEGYYCNSIEETAQYGSGTSQVIYSDLKKKREERQLVMKHMPLEEGQENPMVIWGKQLSKKK